MERLGEFEVLTKGTVEYEEAQKNILKNPVLDGETGLFIEEEDWREKQNQKYIQGLKQQLVECHYMLENYLQNVERFFSMQPFFYDKNQIFWFWDIPNDKWVMVDETDIMNMIEKTLSFHGETVTKGIKSNYIESFKRVGRKNIPLDAPTKWIQFKNKAFSLTAKKVYTVTPKYFFTNPIPWEIGELEDTPVMDKLITEWVGEKYLSTVYEIIAYCCYTSYPIQVLFCFYGRGRNGKSCLLRLISKFIGVQNITSSELDLLTTSRFETSKLYKKLICMMGETNFGILQRSSIIKRLTGGDLIGFEIKNKAQFDGYSYAKIVIASNSLPTSDDNSDGFYRRWCILDFPNQFQEGKDILETIPEKEYNNLAKKVLKVLPELLARGTFTNQGTIEERKEKYVMASNPLPIFLKKYCKIDSNSFCSYAELYSVYVKFLLDNKKRKVKLKEFRSALEDEGFYVEKTSKEIDGIWKSGNYVIGLEILGNSGSLGSESHSVPIYSDRVENVFPKSTKVTKNEEKVAEEIVLHSFESYPKESEFVACQIEGCMQTPCKRDKHDVPYCKFHFEGSALQ